MEDRIGIVRGHQEGMAHEAMRERTLGGRIPCGRLGKKKEGFY